MNARVAAMALEPAPAAGVERALVENGALPRAICYVPIVGDRRKPSLLQRRRRARASSSRAGSSFRGASSPALGAREDFSAISVSPNVSRGPTSAQIETR